MDRRPERRNERNTLYKAGEGYRGGERREQVRENKDRSNDLETQRLRRERQMSHRRNYEEGTNAFKAREPAHRPQAVYREVSKTREVSRKVSPVQTRTTPTHSKGVPFESSQQKIPTEALETAMEEIREVMTQYSNIADPSESAARKERFRQAEEQGQIKETAEAMVRAELEAQTQELQGLEEPGIRIPATHRISFPPATETHVERIPASRRLALAPPPVSEKGRLPIAARLGTTKLVKPSETGGDPDATSKRKPGRPPGKRKVLASPRTGAGTNPRRRKPQQTNAPKCKKK
ncbi:unnamed protein product, partial [Brassica rapa]